MSCMERTMTPDQCPVCGAEVPTGARACPECGSDEKTGWSDRARYDEIGVPDDESFSYDEFVKREFGGEKPKRKNQTVWIVAAILVLLAFAYMIFGRAF
jgi:predicted nucleic acid-binding Zn ribbon protein